jgi:hypothetical protein
MKVPSLQKIFNHLLRPAPEGAGTGFSVAMAWMKSHRDRTIENRNLQE